MSPSLTRRVTIFIQTQIEKLICPHLSKRHWKSFVCGRLTLRAPAASWCQMFLPDMLPNDPAEMLPVEVNRPRYNIAPTQPIATVIRSAVGGQREIQVCRWGLVPSWSDDLAIGSRMINARSETADSKPSFKRALAKRRCIIPMDGYYEWQKIAGSQQKQPYLIHHAANHPMALAGLWEINKKIAGNDQPIITCTILTTQANETTAAIHDRMPVILDHHDWDQWLDPGFRDTAELKSLLVPAAEQLLRTTSVSTHVNKVANEDSQCIIPVETEPQPRSLFD